MELSANLILLGLVINRIVEAIKNALPEENGAAIDRWRTPLILLLSFALGAIAMIFVFPSDNLFPTASSNGAGLIFTGILVGGVANGWDFLGSLGDALVARLQQPRTQNTTVWLPPAQG